MILAAALLTISILNAAPPHDVGVCKWVHGRFGVWNGSSVRRIWIIGTHRLIALKDDDDDVPMVVHDYMYSGSYPAKADGLFGDFRVCALERSRTGHMQHVRLVSVKRLTFRRSPFKSAS